MEQGTPEPPHAKTMETDSSRPVYHTYREGKHIIEEDKDGEVVRVLEDVPADSFDDDLKSFSNRLADFDLSSEHRHAIMSEVTSLLHRHAGHKHPQSKPLSEEHYDVQKPGHVPKDQYPPEDDTQQESHQQGSSDTGEESTLISKIKKGLDVPKKSFDILRNKD